MLLTKRGSNLLFILLMVLIMAGVLSFTATFISAGFTAGFFTKWLRAYAISFCVGLPTALLVVPPLRRFTDSLAR